METQAQIEREGRLNGQFHRLRFAFIMVFFVWLFLAGFMGFTLITILFSIALGSIVALMVVNRMRFLH